MKPEEFINEDEEYIIPVSWEVYSTIKVKGAKNLQDAIDILDFGNVWYGLPCSQKYWDDVNPIFDRLIEGKNNKEKWTDFPNKENTVYIPLLHAFMDEINRAYEQDKELPRKLLEYLIGSEDYYKVVSLDNKRLTMIHTFNVHGDLNKPSKVKVSAISVPIVELPTEIIVFRFKPNSDNTVEMYLNNGWQISFRIHNADSKVEPSLKFAIKFEGMPANVLNLECRWAKK